MKKTSSISALGVYALLLCGVCLHYSCRLDRSDCSKYEITQQETAFLSAYNKGDIAFFKNDTTGVFDTLHVIDMGYGSGYYGEPCNKTVNTALNAQFSFSHLHGCGVYIWHNTIPEIIYSYTNYEFLLSGSLQSMTINSTSFNDVYIPSLDSTKITSADRNSVPWKIAYSKSKGFIRFYMVNGQTWSKL